MTAIWINCVNYVEKPVPPASVWVVRCLVGSAYDEKVMISGLDWKSYCPGEERTRGSCDPWLNLHFNSLTTRRLSLQMPPPSTHSSLHPPPIRHSTLQELLPFGIPSSTNQTLLLPNLSILHSTTCLPFKRPQSIHHSFSEVIQLSINPTLLFQLLQPSVSPPLFLSDTPVTHRTPSTILPSNTPTCITWACKHPIHPQL